MSAVRVEHAFRLEFITQPLRKLDVDPEMESKLACARRGVLGEVGESESLELRQWHRGGL